MKKLLFVISILFSFAASAQNFYVIGKDTISGRPGYLYLQRPLYTQSPLFKVNDSTLGVNSSFIGIDSITDFKYSQTNQSRVVKLGLIDSVTTNGIQYSPSFLQSGIDTVLTGLKKKVGFETYVQPLLNTAAVNPYYVLRWFADTSVNTSTGVATGYNAMDLYHNSPRNQTGPFTTLDFPQGAYITGFGNVGAGAIYGIHVDNQAVSFTMGSNTPVSIAGNSLTMASNGFIQFGDLTLNLSKVATHIVGIGVYSTDRISAGFQCKNLNVGYYSSSLYGKNQFSVISTVYGNAYDGTVSSTSGSPNFTGIGTWFLSQFNVGDSIAVSANFGVSYTKYKIASITDNTHLTTTTNSTITSSGMATFYDVDVYQQPLFSVNPNGTPYFPRPFITSNFSGKTTTIAAGTGAGTSPTVSITGNDISGYVTITTGTSCTASGNIVTITFATPLMGTPTSIILTAANSNAATEFTKVYVDQSTASTTTWVIKNTSSALTDATAYKFYYHVTQ